MKSGSSLSSRDLARYTEVKYKFKQYFYMNTKFDELLSEIDLSLTSPCQHNTLKDLSLSYIHATPCDNVT